MRFIRSSDITIPPRRGTAPPVYPVPPPRTTSGTRSWSQSPASWEISAVFAGRTTRSAGWSSFNASAPYDESAEGSLNTNGPPVMPVTRSMKPDGSGATLPGDSALTLPLLHELEDAAGSLSQTIQRGCVGDSEKTRRVEAFARRHRHARFVQQRLREVARVADTDRFEHLCQPRHQL